MSVPAKKQARQAFKPKKSTPSPLEVLLTIEGEALEAKDILSLKHIAVNRPRALLKFGHIIWVHRSGNSIRLDAISSQAQIDKTTPFAQWMTSQLSLRARRNGLDTEAEWRFENSDDADSLTYPFSHAFYAPFSPYPESGGLLFTRDTAFRDNEKPQMKRLSKIFGVTASAMGQKKRARMSLKKQNFLLGTVIILGLLACIPVPMTTLAPAEIVAEKPYVITAPMDGVVEEIMIPPNTLVDTDTPLIRLVDTTYKNEYILAEQEQFVADAKLRQASLTSFIDNKAKREIAVAQAEKNMANARQNYARDRLAKTVMTAPKPGLAIYSDPTDWAGRPVSTGETIIQIADPSKVLLRIDVPLAVGESLEKDARVRMFMDSDPLTPIEAELQSASFYAQATPNGNMAYEAFASLDISDSEARPRIGSRGVAKIYGETAPLGFWLLRRPMTIARQFLGI
jgi:hypothetical protein